MPVSDDEFKQMSSIFSRRTDLRLAHVSRLVDGHYLENRVTGKWVLSIYRNVKNTANDVEIAIDWRPLVWPAEGDQFRRALDWLRMQKDELENEPSGIHSTQPAETFRIGLLREGAQTFLHRLSDRLADKSGCRWDLPHSTPKTRGELPTADDHGVSRVSPSDGWPSMVEQMLQTVRSTCEQSGKTQTVVAKTKEFRFASEDGFREHVRGLLEAAHGKCALTGVALDFSRADPDMAPSLDRIDSDGHYEPGNLQVVARFANRWKSDDSDDRFRRLLDAVRRMRPDA